MNKGVLYEGVGILVDGRFPDERDDLVVEVVEVVEFRRSSLTRIYTEELQKFTTSTTSTTVPGGQNQKNASTAVLNS